MRDFVLAHDFKLALNYHSYGGFLIYPYGYTSDPAEDEPTFQHLANLMTQENRLVYGTGMQTLSYRTNGDADDWMYGGEEKPVVFAMTPELGTVEHGFWPHEEDIEVLCKQALSQNLVAAGFLLNSATMIDESTPYLTETAGEIPISMARLGFDVVGIILRVRPLTPNIEFSSTDRLYTLGLNREPTSLSYRLASGIEPGTEIRFVVEVDNGALEFRDTITKYFYRPDYLLANDGRANDWITSGLMASWRETTRKFYSAPTSLTDSPTGNTVPYTTNYLTSRQAFPLHGSDSVVLTFKALWDIQNRTDYATVEISTDGRTFVPLCGKYSQPGKLRANEGLPVYTGRQQTWVTEVIDLTPYRGFDVTLRFGMISTHLNTREGIYIDDIEILQFNEGIITHVDHIDVDQFSAVAMPNPASDLVTIRTNHTDGLLPHRVVVYDARGQMVFQSPFQDASSGIEISLWPSGMYFYVLFDHQGRVASRPGKLMVNR